MDKITDLIEKLENFKENINGYLEQATIEAEDTIIDMNIYQLYDEGENSEGKPITPEYAPATVEIKRSKGQPTNRVTLRDTFDWQGSFWINYQEDGFEIKASDWKTEELQKKYGTEILGLQDANVKVLCENFYLPHLINELRSILGI